MNKNEVKELLSEVNLYFEDFIKWVGKEKSMYKVDEVHQFITLKTQGLNTYWN